MSSVVRIEARYKKLRRITPGKLLHAAGLTRRCRLLLRGECSRGCSEGRSRGARRTAIAAGVQRDALSEKSSPDGRSPVLSENGLLCSVQATVGLIRDAAAGEPLFLCGHVFCQACQSPRLVSSNTAICAAPYFIVVPPSLGKNAVCPASCPWRADRVLAAHFKGTTNGVMFVEVGRTFPLDRQSFRGRMRAGLL